MAIRERRGVTAAAPRRIASPRPGQCGGFAPATRRHPHSRPKRPAREYVARIAHPQVHPRASNTGSERCKRIGPTSGSSRVAATANANADAEWPEGNDDVLGMCRSRRRGARRCRPASSFMGPLTAADVTASARRPRCAARRPRSPRPPRTLPREPPTTPSRRLTGSASRAGCRPTAGAGASCGASAGARWRPRDAMTWSGRGAWACSSVPSQQHLHTG
jgi:hypothetical protein